MSIGKVEIVVDTNVAVVANGKTEQAKPSCIIECITRLQEVQAENCLLLDDRNLVLDEYKNRLSFSGQPGSGDAFFKWLWDNQANPGHCRKVTVHLHAGRGFEEFPDDPILASFDNKDRKFVAVALASGTDPEILNASDTDWWHHRQGLQQQGVNVVFLCPELMKAKVDL